jgi:hypothetical protein
VVVLMGLGGVASAQTQPDDPWTAPTAPAAAPGDEAAPSTDGVKPMGYIELYDQWNFRQPSNGVTNLRGFDDRHASFTLQNVVLGADWTKGAVHGRIALQVGDAGDTYYEAEPTQGAMGTAPQTSPTEWRHLQEAWVGWKVPCTKLELQGGLFVSAIGPEVPQTKDNWNWSRSDAFFMLPYFHTGVRGVYALDDHWTATLALYNGWNNAIDNNNAPSLHAVISYASGPWSATADYFGGIERAPDAPEGQPWRHTFDAYAQGPIAGKLSFLVHGDAGFERTTFGRSSWATGAAYLKYDITPNVYLAGRGDLFREWRALDATQIFLPTSAFPFDPAIGQIAQTAWVASATATLTWRPMAGLDLRAEYRHDGSSGDVYFGGNVPVDGNGQAVPNRNVQDTVTGGVVAWF